MHDYTTFYPVNYYFGSWLLRCASMQIFLQPRGVVWRFWLPSCATDLVHEMDLTPNWGDYEAFRHQTNLQDSYGTGCQSRHVGSSCMRVSIYISFSAAHFKKYSFFILCIKNESLVSLFYTGPFHCKTLIITHLINLSFLLYVYLLLRFTTFF